MAERGLCRFGLWCSRVFAVECKPYSDPFYFELSKNPQPSLCGEKQTFENTFGRAKAYSFHVCTDDRFQRAILYERLKNKLLPALPKGGIFDVLSFLPDVQNSLFRGFLIKDAEAVSVFDELVRSSWVNVCTYHEQDNQWWQHLWSKSDDGIGVLIDKYCLVPARMPSYHPSTLNIMGNDLFYSFGDAYKVMEQCVEMIPEAMELLKLVDQNLSRKQNGRFPTIVIEGLDATGKTTLTQSLTVVLGATLLRSPPECLSPWRPCFDSEPPLLRRAFYALGNYITASQISTASLNTPIVVDRFWHSTAAYAIATAVTGKVDNLPSSGSEVYRWPSDLLRPDLVLLLTVSPEERVRRLSVRGAKKTREEAELEANHLFRTKVEEAYKRVEDPACIVVDASPPPDQVLQQVLLLIKDKCHL